MGFSLTQSFWTKSVNQEAFIAHLLYARFHAGPCGGLKDLECKVGLLEELLAGLRS